MIISIFGPDTYRSRKKVREIIEGERKEHGSELSVHRFDAEDDNAGILRRLLEGQSLFSSQRRGVVVNYAFGGQEEVGEILKTKAPAMKDYKDTVVILWDAEIAGSGKKQFDVLTPFFSETYEMKKLSGSQLIRWVGEESKERGLNLGAEDLRRVSMIGDSWAIAHELDKMAAGGVDASGVSGAKPVYTVFQLSDSIGRPAAESLRILHGLLQQGEDEHRLFSYVAGHIRAIVAAAFAAGARRAMPPELGIHPFVAKKAAHQARGLSSDDARALIYRVLEEDYRIKTGVSTARESLERILMYQKNTATPV